ncbi:hypothetical protein C5708_14630 [Caulobacter sp. CCUG 60055]|uniref:hypothetical protein n=1 Tax=Caulobacter sp. CCUG 60055 TaxID=2100090 RepID=UPI001FA6D718|nr:hypothetical protein [Caulobacter sp. CCUG 60055]MBQ1543589.1 hypothetical protein [Caulobacteraceae bacterium]MCI3181488.1 hypothetical protein [Caulobacter sp. CCUG 60055]
MRMMLKVVLPTDTGNAAVKDGSLSRILDEAITRLNAEAAYFGPSDGCRSAMIFFDMKDASEMPSISEAFFMNFEAAVELTPVMNREDLKKGLAALAR